MSFPFGEPTEEMKAELKRRRELHDMAHHDSVAATNDLVESLDEDKLDTLKAMLAATVGDEKDTYALHMMGWISARLYFKYGVCLACGKKHDEIPTTDTAPTEALDG